MFFLISINCAYPRCRKINLISMKSRKLLFITFVLWLLYPKNILHYRVSVQDLTLIIRIFNGFGEIDDIDDFDGFHDIYDFALWGPYVQSQIFFKNVKAIRPIWPRGQKIAANAFLENRFFRFAKKFLALRWHWVALADASSD